MSRPGPRSGLHAVLASLLADRRVRFLLVGGFNVVQGVGWFSLLRAGFGDRLPYLLALVISYVPAILLAFWLYRTFVFRARGHLKLDFVRFVMVQAAALGVNAVSLPFFHELLRVPLVVAQACSIVVIIVFNFVGHLYFSFRRRHDPPSGQGVDLAEAP